MSIFTEMRKKHLADPNLEFLFKSGQRRMPLALRKQAPGTENSIYAMRHGRTTLDPLGLADGWLDFPLSDDGRARLILNIQYLERVPLKAIYAPTLRRTSESGLIVRSGVLSEPSIIPADDMRTWKLGAIQGKNKKANKQLVSYFINNPDEIPEGGESRNHFRGRFFGCLGQIQADVLAGNGPALCIWSGSNFRELSLELFGDKTLLDLDEGGMLVMTPVAGKWTASVIFGHKDEENENLS